MTTKEELPDNIEELVEQHNKNHDTIDRVKSNYTIRKAQSQNRKIRDKLVEELEVPRAKANELVDQNREPKTFREECQEIFREVEEQ